LSSDRRRVRWIPQCALQIESPRAWALPS
jgi:hypothetical protein